MRLKKKNDDQPNKSIMQAIEMVAMGYDNEIESLCERIEKLESEIRQLKCVHEENFGQEDRAKHYAALAEKYKEYLPTKEPNIDDLEDEVRELVDIIASKIKDIYKYE